MAPGSGRCCWYLYTCAINCLGDKRVERQSGTQCNNHCLWNGETAVAADIKVSTDGGTDGT